MAPAATLIENRFSVSNLSCGGCVSRAEKALLTAPGVARASVNLATRKADVTSAGPLDVGALQSVMRDAGYPVALSGGAASIRFTVQNMTCASCVQNAEAALLAQPGVISATVNFATRTADIETTSVFDVRQTQLAMHSAGYPVEPVTQAAPTSTTQAEEVAEQFRHFLIAAILTLPVFVMEMGGHIFPAFHHWIASTLGVFPARMLQFVLTTLVLFWPGRVFFQHGVPALIRRAPEMNSLVVLGASAAWAFSSVVTFAPGLIPEASRFVYFEAAAVIVTLILLGRFLEGRARGRAGAAISRLMDLRPDSATRLQDGHEEEVPVSEIRVGDVLRLRPGDRVAVDGEVIEGHSQIDESMITGEPMPVEKAVGESVTGGTVNGAGSLIYAARHVGADTVLARIVQMVEDAQATRLPIQSFLNKITGIFVPVVMGLAALASLGWFLFGPDPAVAIVIGVSVLIIACPCAMGLATPVSIMVGTGRAAELGVLFRKGDALQRLGQADIVAFDKTGTLTKGAPSVTQIDAIGDPDDLLALAAAAEMPSEHPLARAIVAEAKARGFDLPKATGFHSLTGSGVEATVNGARIRVGVEELVGKAGSDARAQFAATGQTVIHISRDEDYLGLIALSDPLKPDAKAAIAALRSAGLRVALISGDAKGAVGAVADALGIEEVHARTRPEDKSALVDAWQKEGLVVAFVGDGINDAPVLARADVGIALGSGTDVAIEAADVVLISGAPYGVATAVAMSRRTMSNIVQNLFWAFAYNVALIPVAAGVLALFGGPLLNPMLAAGAMAASSVIVVMNALRLRYVTGVLT